MLALARYAHLLSVAVWIGSIVFFSFIGAPAIFKAVDRKTAGDIVGVIFPKYYALGYVCALASLASLVFIGAKTGFTHSLKYGMAALAVMGALTLVSGAVIAPKARDVKQMIRAETDEAKIAELRGRFGRIHAVSATLNLLTLAAGLVLLWFAVQYMRAG